MSRSEKEDFAFEKEYLAKVIIEISEQYKKALEHTKGFKKVISDTQREMWEEVSAAPNDIENMDELVQARTFLEDLKIQNIQFKSTELRSKRLYSMLYNPYFARIDFQEKLDGDDLENQKIYIGITSLSDKTGDYLIYDWRAPISGMFYDFEIGPASYECLDGVIIGFISRKRQYRIQNGKLDFMFESSLAIDDEILQELLGHSSNSRMKNIVATIQREQNRVIRDSTHNYLLVSGPAGSGKTSVALHRVAWLLYKHKETITPRNILVISPNDIFNDYISNVLPSLGEENMRQMTFKQVMSRIIGADLRLGDFAEQMDFIMSMQDQTLLQARAACIGYKTSSDFRKIICEYIEILEIEPFPFKDLFFRHTKIISIEELQKMYRYEYSFMPVKKRIDKVLQRVKKKINVVMERRMALIIEDYLFKGEIMDKRDIRRRAEAQVRFEFEDVLEEVNTLFQFDALEAYSKLFTDDSLLQNISEATRVPLPAQLEIIAAFTLSNLEDKFIPYEDCAPIVLLKTMAGDIKNTSEIKHVVIDEGQDYTPIQLECVVKMFANAGITILGDAGQSINPYSQVRTFGEFKDVLTNGLCAEVVLTKSYRSTLQITNFCARILDLKEEYEHINREGTLPVVVHATGDRIADMVSRMEEAERNGYHSIAIVCMHAAEAATVHKQIKQFTPVKLVTKEDEEFIAGPCVIPIYLAKGLEFDVVLVYDASTQSMPSLLYDKLLYTACTRAMHELVLYYTGEPTVILERVPKNLFL